MENEPGQARPLHSVHAERRLGTVMGAVARTMMLVALAVVPGGFVALFAYVTGRALLQNWQRASAAPNPSRQPFLAAFSSMRMEDLAREARAVLAM